MGARITPCFRCPLAIGCEQREVFRQKVCGIGAVSVKFRCKRIKDATAPGTRIVVDHPFLDDDGSGYGNGIQHDAIPATITHSDGFSFSCVVDQDERIEDHKHRFRRARPYFRIIRFLDEPKRALCACGNPILEDGSVDTSQGPKPKCDCHVDWNEVTHDRHSVHRL